MGKLTLDQWILKTTLSPHEFAGKAEIDYRVITQRGNRPIKPHVVMKIIHALRGWFDENPNLLKGVNAPVPEYPDDIEGLVVFDANKHRSPRKKRTS